MSPELSNHDVDEMSDEEIEATNKKLAGDDPRGRDGTDGQSTVDGGHFDPPAEDR